MTTMAVLTDAWPPPSPPQGLSVAGQLNTVSPAASSTDGHNSSHDLEDRCGGGPHADTLLLPKWWGGHRRNIMSFPEREL